MYITEHERRATPPKFDYDAFDLPEDVILTFHLNPHSCASDLPPKGQLRREILDSDLVVFEIISNDDDIHTSLHKVSQGNMVEYQRLRALMQSDANDFGDWVGTMLSALYASRVPTTSIDVNFRDASVSKFFRAHELFMSKVFKAHTNEELLDLKDLLAGELDTYRERDQRILGNIKPRLGGLALRNKTLELKQRTRPLNASVFYGTTHRSLVDALIHKMSINPTNGFDVQEHADSQSDNLHESLYAWRLRGSEIPDVAMLRYFSQVLIIAHMLKHGHVPPNLPMDALTTIADKLLEDGDFTDANEIARMLATKTKNT